MHNRPAHHAQHSGTYTVLTAELLVQRSRHNLAADVARSIKVGLAVDATQRADHDVCLETWVVKLLTWRQLPVQCATLRYYNIT